MKRLLPVLFLGMAACMPAPEPIPDTPEMRACIARGVRFYARAPNFPYIESVDRVNAGYAEKIDDHILATCSRSSLAYYTDDVRGSNMIVETPTVR